MFNCHLPLVLRFKKQQKDKEKQRKETHRKNVEQRKSAAASRQTAAAAERGGHALAQDDRFKQVDADRFTKKAKADKTSAPAADFKKTPLPAGLKIKKASSKKTAPVKHKKK